MDRKRSPLSTNPLKTSQPLGGVLALQGFYRAMPVVHGTQGCAAFAKTLLTRHFREPIALQTSALQELDLIFNAGVNLEEAVQTILRKHQPDLLAVLSTALTEVAGDDIYSHTKNFLSKWGKSDCLIVPVSLPDYLGSLQTGFARTVEAVIGGMLAQRRDRLPRKRTRGLVNLLPGSFLTPGDVMEIKETISAYGLEVISIPDVSTSLSGHLLTGHTPLSRGGTPLEVLERMTAAEYTIGVGMSTRKAAELLQDAAGVPYRIFPALHGLRASDSLHAFLQQLSGESAPIRYRWQRENLLDGMLDAHFYYAGRRAVVALEPDHLAGTALWLSDMGVKLTGLVTTVSDPGLEAFLREQPGLSDISVTVGDLGDCEALAASAGADLWISNSHGRAGAERTHAVFAAAGFPVPDELGTATTVSVGYRGTMELINRIGNRLMEKSEHREQPEAELWERVSGE